MKIDNEFNIEDIVYLKTDDEQLERIVVSIIVYPGNNLVYSLACGMEASDHYGFEISKEKKY